MTIGNFTELKAAVEVWRERVGETLMSANAADFISLGEARLTRELPLRIMWTNGALTGTTDSRQLTLPTTFAEPKFLKLTSDDLFRELTKRPADAMQYYATSGVPSEWCINGGFIDLNRPCSSALTFLFRYRQKFALSDAAPTNWLLTNHSDIYLAAVLVWSGLLIEAGDISIWGGLLQNGIELLKRLDAKADADVRLEVDPALLRGGRADIATDTLA